MRNFGQTKARSGRLGRVRQSGQAAVLACLCIFTMVVFVLLSTNVGMLVSDRIRMQNVADATAYAGALEQARILNKVRLYNRSMLRRAAGMRAVLTFDDDVPILGSLPTRLWPKSGGCGNQIAESMLDAHEELVDATHARMIEVLRRGQQSSSRAAQFTAQKNMTGLGFGRSFESYRVYPESPTFARKSLLEPPWDPSTGGSDGIDPELEPMPLEFSYAYYVGADRGCGGSKKCKIFPFRSRCVAVVTRTFNTWWWKKDRNPTVFFPIRLIGTPLRKFFDTRNIRGYFGTSPRKRNNKISVYSVAKPYDGMVGVPDIDEWNNQLHGTESVRVLMSIKKNLHTKGGLEQLYRTFYENNETRFRARIAGVNEDLGNNYSGQLPQYENPPDIAQVEDLFTHGLDRRNLASTEFDRMLH